MKKVMLSLPILFILAFIILLNTRPRPEALQQYLVQVEGPAAPNDLTVQFLGNTNLLFSDGETSILTDGFFTRPSVFKMLSGKIAPNEKAVRKCLAKANIEKLDVVIPLHSHFDHAMDAPRVSDLTGGKLIGSSSTINVGKGYGLSENQMRIPPLNEAIQIGKFKITFIASRHWRYPSAKQRAQLLDQDIEAPLVPPVKMIDYKEGISYTIIIEHDSTKIAIQGTAGFKENTIVDQDVDILFLAIAGIETMDETYNQNYQRLVVEALHPEFLVPIHYDDFTVPLSKGLKTTSVLFNMKMGTNLGKAFEIVERNNMDRVIKVLPLWEKVRIQEIQF